MKELESPDDPFIKFWGRVENLVQNVAVPNAVAFTTVPLNETIPGQYHADEPSSRFEPMQNTMLQSTAILQSYFVVPPQEDDNVLPWHDASRPISATPSTPFAVNRTMNLQQNATGAEKCVQSYLCKSN